MDNKQKKGDKEDGEEKKFQFSGPKCGAVRVKAENTLFSRA